MTSRLVWAALAASLLALTPHWARADGPLSEQRNPIRTSQYAVDLFQGPVLSTSRLTGMGGAFTSLAEGADAQSVNAASPAMRVPWSHDSFDWDLTGGITFPSSLRNTDFDNNGTAGFRYRDFLFLSGGGTLQFGPWGVGISADLQSYALGRSEGAGTAAENLNLNLTRYTLVLARALADHQVFLGAGLRGVTLNAVENASGRNDTLLSMTGASLMASAVWAPKAAPLRLGAHARMHVDGNVQEQSSLVTPNAQGDLVVGNLYLPKDVQSPWEVELAAAWQFGARPLNTGFWDRRAVPRAVICAERRPGDGEKAVARRHLRERVAALPRSKVLVAASVLLTGPVRNGVGLESMLTQVVDRSGESVSVTPRVGVEMEPIPTWLQVRAGTYLEPTRYREGLPRVHGTTGFDVKVLPWTVFGLFDEGTWWRAGGFVDYTRDYLAWSVSVGVWH